MNVTDELRRLLDECGVKWTSERVSDGVLFTFAKDGHTYSVFVRDRAGLEVWSKYLTPEQAIAATLGTGTCHMRLACEEEDADGCIWPDHYECDVCGANVNGIMPYCDTEVPPHFCPNCGRKVVAE